MIVIGADTAQAHAHRRRRSMRRPAQLRGERTVPARDGAASASCCAGRARSTRERVWAIEDCRHVSGALERFLLARGERVVRVPPKLMAGARRRGARARQVRLDRRARGRARRAARGARDAAGGAARRRRRCEIRLLRRPPRGPGRRSAPRDQQRLRWHLHDLWPELEIPAGALDRRGWLERVAAPPRPRRADRPRADRARAGAPHPRAHPPRSTSSSASSPRLRRRATRRSCSSCPAAASLTAAKLIGEIAGVERFATDAKLARIAGVAPIPASSGARTATASTAAATASSTARCTASPSPKAACDPDAARLPRAQASRRQDPPRSAPLPQAPPRPHRLPAP